MKTVKQYVKGFIVQVSVVLSLCWAVVATPAGAVPLNGVGTEANPYLIASLADLVTFRDWVNAGNNCAGEWFQLTANIDLGGAEWTPIGTTDATAKGAEFPFSGIFDGQNNEISNFKVTTGFVRDDDVTLLGFFGCIYAHDGYVAGVKNLTLANATFGSFNQPNTTVGVIAPVILSDSNTAIVISGVNIMNTSIYSFGYYGQDGIASLLKANHVTIEDCNLDIDFWMPDTGKVSYRFWSPGFGQVTMRGENQQLVFTNFDASACKFYHPATCTLAGNGDGTGTQTIWVHWTNGITVFACGTYIGQIYKTGYTVTIEGASYTQTDTNTFTYDGEYANNVRIGVITHNDFTGSYTNHLAEIVPAFAAAGGGDIILTAFGSYFTESAKVFWNATELETTFVSSTQLNAVVPAAHIATTGSASVTVGGTGAAKTFTILEMPSEVWVDDNYTHSSCGGHAWNYDAFTSIQDGVDAVAAGGTVNVAAGTYAFPTINNITISKGISILGEARDTVVLDDTYSPPRGNGIFSVNGIPAGQTVRFANLTFRTPSRAINIASEEGAVVADNCRFVMTGNNTPMVGADNMQNANFALEVVNSIFETADGQGGSATTYIYTSCNAVADPMGVYVITNNVFNGNARAIGAVVNNTLVAGNTFNLTCPGEYGIQIYARSDAATGGGLGSVVITNNTFNMSAEGAYCISIKQLSGKIPAAIAESPVILRNKFLGTACDVYLWNNLLSFAENAIDVSYNYSAGGVAPRVGYQAPLAEGSKTTYSPWYADAAMTVLYYTPAGLAFTTQPGGALPGRPFAQQPVVAMFNEIGGVASQFQGQVALAIGANPGGGVLSGNAALAAVNGVVAFTDLALDNVGVGYTLVASVAGYPAVTSAVFNVSKTNQTIDFPAIPDQVTTSTVVLSATASSGLPVSFAVVSGPGTINGNSLTFSGAGIVKVVASQAGDAVWNPAPNVTNTVTVRDVSSLAAPRNLAASDGAFTNKVDLTWSPVSGATGYEVWRATANNAGAAVCLGQVGAPGYADASSEVLSAIRYYYWVKACNSAVTSDFSNVDSGFCRLCDDPEIISGQPMVGDYDGDGKADPAVYDLATGQLYAWLSASAYALTAPVANFQVAAADLPVAGDFDGDGLADPGVFQNAAGAWYGWLSGSGYHRLGPVAFGVNAEDAPVPADYDGDGLTDPAVHHSASGEWYAWLSSGGYVIAGPIAMGTPGEGLAAPADYDGDGNADPALYHSASGEWYAWLSSGGYAMAGPVAMGTPGEHLAVPADYDGDGKADPASYIPTNGVWRVWQSGNGYTLLEAPLR